MITEKDLQEAIAECKGARNPNANTCIKLAAFLIIQEHMFGSQKEELPQSGYSFAAQPEQVSYRSDTEFFKAVDGMTMDELLKVTDELMTALQVINPRLYASVMRKVAE